MSCMLVERSESGLTEAQAIQRAQQGDCEGFDYLYRAHKQRVYVLCLRVVRNTADAEDLTQQVFLLLFRAIGAFRGDSRFSTWLHRVALNTALTYQRRRKTDEANCDSEDLAADYEALGRFRRRDTSMLGAAQRLSLLRAISELPAFARKLFLLHDVMGYGHAEIAELVGCSASCSRLQIHRARKRLRHML